MTSEEMWDYVNITKTRKIREHHHLDDEDMLYINKKNSDAYILKDYDITKEAYDKHTEYDRKEHQKHKKH